MNARRLKRQYCFGLSPKGFLAVVLLLLPNVIWMIFPPADNPLAEGDIALFWSILENALRVVAIASLVLIVPRRNREMGTPIKVGVWLCLGGYYVCWVLYYLGVNSPWMLVLGMAALPQVFAILYGVTINNRIASLCWLPFSILHIVLAIVQHF